MAFRKSLRTLINSYEMAEVCQKDRSFDCASEARAGGRRNGGDVLEALIGLRDRVVGVGRASFQQSWHRYREKHAIILNDLCFWIVARRWMPLRRCTKQAATVAGKKNF